jgi:peptide/nickel transport system permease protein
VGTMTGKARGGRGRILVRRLVQFVPVVILATLVVFELLQLVPGDPAVMLAGENATPEHVIEIRHAYGFDRPFLIQYVQWLFHALHGDLSRSFFTKADVTTAILQSFPNTLLVASLALILSLAVGIPLGILAATHVRRPIDLIIGAISSMGVAVPTFWLAMILVAVFALKLHWLPATGAVAVGQDFGRALSHALLPAVTLAAGGIALVTRQLRSALIEVLNSPFVRTLHAKGLSPTLILWKHCLKNVGVTLLTVTGLLFNGLLGATVVIEAVFAIPGMGSLVVNAAINRDFPIVQGVVLTLVVVVILVNLAIDLLYAWIDPRMGET